MNPSRLDPSLGMLLAMTPEQLARVAAERRLALRLQDGDAWVDVTIRIAGELPPSDEVRVTDRLASVITANVRLGALDALTERPEVIYVSPVRAGRPLLHRTRAEVGAAITDGALIRGGADPWDGTGVSVGIIDSGFDLTHPAFRRFPGGPTRVEWFWDRQVAPRPGDTVGRGGIGVVYSRANIDAHLLGPAAVPPVLHPNSLDFIGHGSHVAGIAAGRGTPYRGIAPGATLILVALLDADIGILHNLCDWFFARPGGPCAINISQCNTAGPHDGTTDVETGLDALLRDAPTLVPRPGRFIAIAAGNDRFEGWHVHARVLPTGRPLTQLGWDTPGGNTAADEVVFWYRGLDRIRVRLVGPVAVGAATRVTHGVAPDPLGCVEVAHGDPGNFAPTAAGPASSKTFDFVGAARAIIAQGENPLNGDRQILLRLEPLAAGGAIGIGLWLIELEGIGELPAGGRVDGWVNMSAAAAAPDTRLLRPALTARTLFVAPAPTGGPGPATHLDVHAPAGVPREFRVLLDYSADETLEVQVRPPLRAIHPAAGAVGAPDRPTQWVGFGPVVTADAALTAPNAPVAAAVPVSFGFGQIPSPLTVNMLVGARRLITVHVQPPAGPGATPDAGLYQASVRSAAPAVPRSSGRPVEVHARLAQDHTDTLEICVFRDEPFAIADVEVFPTCSEAVTRLALGANAVARTRLEVTLPGGARAHVRVRIPPRDQRQDNSGWTATPFVSPGPAPVAHVDGTVTVTIAYPAHAAGADGQIVITVEDAGGSIHEGEWQLEFRGVGIAAPRVLRTELVHVADEVGHGGFEGRLAPALSRGRLWLGQVERGPIPVAFTVDRATSDEIRLELFYDERNDIRVSVPPPPPPCQEAAS